MPDDFGSGHYTHAFKTKEYKGVPPPRHAGTRSHQPSNKRTHCLVACQIPDMVPCKRLDACTATMKVKESHCRQTTGTQARTANTMQAPAHRSRLSPVISCERHIDLHTAPCSSNAWAEVTRTNTVNIRADTLATQNASRSSYPSTCARGNPCKHVLIIMRCQLAVGRSLVACSASTHA